MPLRGPGTLDGLFAGFLSYTANATLATYLAASGGLGTVTISASGSLSLTQDLYCDNLVMGAGSSLYCNGWGVFVRQTLTMNASAIWATSNTLTGGIGNVGVPGAAGGTAQTGTS